MPFSLLLTCLYLGIFSQTAALWAALTCRLAATAANDVFSASWSMVQSQTDCFTSHPKAAAPFETSVIFSSKDQGAVRSSCLVASMLGGRLCFHPLPPYPQISAFPVSCLISVWMKTVRSVSSTGVG